MANDLTKKYEKLISLFTKDEFDGFVKIFIRNYWQISDVVIVDGSNDGGVDVKLFLDKNSVNIPIQLTVQKLGVSKKLEEDFEKIRELVRNHGYNNHLIFFYSQTMAEDSQRNLKKKAREEYSLSLEIFDAKALAGVAETYPEIKNYIHDKANIPIVTQDRLEFDRETKMLYDLITYGNETTEIKSRILECFILHKLYEKDNYEVQKLNTDISENFGTSGDPKLGWRKLMKLSTDKRVTLSGGETGCACLSQNEKDRINKVKENFKFEEEFFNYSLSEFLKEYSLLENFTEVRNILIKFFRENYEFDLYEITSGRAPLKTTKDAYEVMKTSFSGLIDQKDLEQFLTKIISLCNEYDIIQRICAGEAFTKLTNPENLQQYINNIEHNVYIDTAVVLYLICALLQKSDYDNPKYQSALNFISFIESSNDKINLKISNHYLKEVTANLKEALDLAPFVENNLISPLGGTKNVFVNFFLYLKKANQIDFDYNYESFLNDLNINPNFITSSKGTRDFISESIEYSLKEAGYEVVNINYTNNYEDIKKDLENVYSLTNRSRPEISASFDAHMLNFLFDSEKHSSEPSFVTWDGSIQDFRKEYHRKHPNAFFWHLFTPSKLVSHLSLLRFNVNSQCLTNDILSLVEDDFEIRGRVSNLLGSIATLVNIKSKHGLKLARQIAEFRSNQIYQVNKLKDSSSLKEEEKPIDSILFTISDYYAQKKGKFNINQFKVALNNETQTENILLILRGELEFLLQNSNFRPNHLYTSFDKIISESLSKKE